MTPKTINILIGEGSAEPTAGFNLAQQLFAPNPVTFFFGVRRSSEGLDTLNTDDINVVANFPGRGMSPLTKPPRHCNMSAYNITRAIDSQRLSVDALLVVATPPDANGDRSLGTANGPLQSAIDSAPLIIVEEWDELPLIEGAATIPASKTVKVIKHQPAAFTALSRPPADLDFECARHIASLLGDNIPIQIGVGGIIEALADHLKSNRGLRIISGAVGNTIRSLYQAGALDPQQKIMGTALVGDDDLIEWAKQTPSIQLMPSRQIHNAQWLAKIENFHSVNIALSVDLQGNVNAESVGDRRVSGKGGSPDFAKGAYLSPGGHSIVALRTDRGNCLHEKIKKPTISGHMVSYIVTEKGIANLIGKTPSQRESIIRELFQG